MWPPVLLRPGAVRWRPWGFANYLLVSGGVSSVVTPAGARARFFSPFASLLPLVFVFRLTGVAPPAATPSRTKRVVGGAAAASGQSMATLVWGEAGFQHVEVWPLLLREVSEVSPCFCCDSMEREVSKV